MLVHMFGCYFGLALSWWFRPAKTESADQRDDRDEKLIIHRTCTRSLAQHCCLCCSRRLTP